MLKLKVATYFFLLLVAFAFATYLSIKFKKVKYLLATISILAIGCVTIASLNLYVISQSSQLIFDNIEDIPHNEYGLLLGANKYINRKKKYKNYYYLHRVRAAQLLYENEKIEKIIISGDNKTHECDDLLKDLIELGIPREKIILDPIGYRTFTSVENAKEMGITELTFISQKFHNQRAIFIAQSFGMNTIGFNARTPSHWYLSRVRLREFLARTKAVFDVLRNSLIKHE